VRVFLRRATSRKFGTLTAISKLSFFAREPFASDPFYKPKARVNSSIHMLSIKESRAQEVLSMWFARDGHNAELQICIA
jgi:hypothetical protein